ARDHRTVPGTHERIQGRREDQGAQVGDPGRREGPATGGPHREDTVRLHHHRTVRGGATAPITHARRTVRLQCWRNPRQFPAVPGSSRREPVPGTWWGATFPVSSYALAVPEPGN